MAAHRQKKRKRCADETGPRPSAACRCGRLPSLSCMKVVVVVMVAAVLLEWSESGVVVNALPINTTESMVASKTSISGPCVDTSGNVVGDGGSWTNGCTQVFCREEPSGNYTVTLQCRDLVDSENPDSANCHATLNQTAPYPDCCPFLECGSASGLTTIDPSLCRDVSSFGTCQIWKELSSNCTLTTSLAYNFTLTYCQATCGHCGGGVG